jgi:hypothetical protein
MDRREVNVTALVSGLVFIALGLLFLLERLAVLDISARYVVPVLLVGLGVGILFGSRRRDPDARPAEPPEPKQEPSTD